MNITSALRSVVEYHMTLSEQDRAECLADPHTFGERLARQFEDLAAPVANGGVCLAQRPPQKSPGAAARPRTSAGSPNDAR